ncbi:MAG: CpsB/CapC family capsule biosynthesis tyrosine phosphatase [Bacteroidales bacterium]|jgi:tyrosine-protein phosphatase YwqE|nr:CpsB/CapC family capsule biosynthesis tyrosine phosphatase [Bacteroidales bacterium]
MGLFDWLKKDNNHTNGIDLSVLHTDIHSHLIPGIDDGSPDMDTSLALLKELEMLGYKKIITTPHVKTEYFQNDVTKLDDLCERLRRAARFEGIKLDIEVGAEHLLDEGVNQRIKNGQFKTFGDNYLLVELPFMFPPFGLDGYIFELQLAGYKLILAHPERYLYWLNDFNQFIRLKDSGVLFQVNIISLGNYYGKDVYNLAKKLIDNNMVELLGTDTHSAKHIEAVRKSCSSSLLKKLLESGRIINKEF